MSSRRTPGVRRDDVERFARIAFSFLQASVIAARKSLHVSGRFSFSSRTRGEGAARRKAHRNRPRHVFRIAGKQRHTATPLGAPPRRLLRPWDRDFRQQARASSLIRAGFPALHPLPSSPKAAPRSGHGRLPKAPRVRGARPPRPQAPHPAPRYKRPGNAPQVGRDRKEFSLYGKICQAGGRLNFWGQILARQRSMPAP